MYVASSVVEIHGQVGRAPSNEYKGPVAGEDESSTVYQT